MVQHSVRGNEGAFYPRRISQIIDRYGLDRWDSVVGPSADTGPDA